jgi:nucleoside-diphosphate-sugar epimerase
MCYVDNVVDANLLAALSDRKFKGDCYNIACNDSTTNGDILTYFINNFSVKVRNASWRPGDVMHTRADVSKAKEELGYEPKVRFWEGLERTVKWWGLK